MDYFEDAKPGLRLTFYKLKKLPKHVFIFYVNIKNKLKIKWLLNIPVIIALLFF